MDWIVYNASDFESIGTFCFNCLRFQLLIVLNLVLMRRYYKLSENLLGVHVHSNRFKSLRLEGWRSLGSLVASFAGTSTAASLVV